jgi:hypothetical protein
LAKHEIMSSQFILHNSAPIKNPWTTLLPRVNALSRSWLDARGPGRPGLRRCRQGGLDCLTSARVRGQGGRSGLRTRCACLRTGRFSGARDWAFGSPLLLADNYNHTTNDPTTEAQSAQRNVHDFRSPMRMKMDESHIYDHIVYSIMKRDI